MTSSLVGSEMCIRDSLIPYIPYLPFLLPHRLEGKGRRKVKQHHNILCAVSYTHLTLPTICSV
eukprot:7191077-Prorocentrum_lima.AAC.1